MSAQHTPGLWRPMRKPGPRQRRGVSAIRSEIEAIIADLHGYGKFEKGRRDDLIAGIGYIDAAIAKATTEQS